MHQSRPQGAVTLRSSFVATLIALFIVFFLGGPPGPFPDPTPAPTPAPTDTGEAASHEASSSAAPAETVSGQGSSSSKTPAATRPAGEGGRAEKPLAGRTIVLDPGHGGADPGAIGASGKTREAYNTLFVALDAKNMLERAGARVVMTRRDDRYVSLSSRASTANRIGADIFISIHNDSNPNGAVRGATTYYYHERSRLLAETMQKQLVQTLGARDVGVVRRSFHVVRETTMPSVLLELGFLSNQAEERLLADPTYRYRAAQAIYNGVLDYFNRVG